MARACFYTGRTVTDGVCDDCTCTDAGTGDAYAGTLIDPIGQVMVAIKPPRARNDDAEVHPDDRYVTLKVGD